MLSLNWIDYLILFVLAIYAYEGYVSGFVRSILDLASFFLAFLIGLRFYNLVAGLLMQKFSLSLGFSNALGFFILAFIAEIIFGMIIRKFLSFNLEIFKNLNKILGIFPGILSGAILISFLLIFVIALPLATPVKRTISSSKIGNYLLFNAQGWEKQLNKVFGGAISDTINFLTVEPKGNEIVSLNFKTGSFSPDSQAEQYMFQLVNKERATAGVGELVFDNELRDIGRAHCEDMFKRGYFSHYTPEGFSPFDRMDQAGIIYSYAGENLALSPNTDIAMQGLMNSPGHKANILSPNFGRIGVGSIDGGIYGEMFCQEFTN
jgi:uncharacterized protein YkwD